MSDGRIPMTQQAYKRLAEELEHLKKHDRPAIILEISTARAQGDISENAEYHAAKERQGMLEDRIKSIEDKIARSEIVVNDPSSSSRIIFGAVVSVKNLGTKKVMEYTLVGSEDVDVMQNRISCASPIGQGLLGKKTGDVVEVLTPRGPLKLEILNYR